MPFLWTPLSKYDLNARFGRFLLQRHLYGRRDGEVSVRRDSALQRANAEAPAASSRGPAHLQAIGRGILGELTWQACAVSDFLRFQF